jgi:hypothetical protein
MRLNEIGPVSIGVSMTKFVGAGDAADDRRGAGLALRRAGRTAAARAEPAA